MSGARDLTRLWTPPDGHRLVSLMATTYELDAEFLEEVRYYKAQAKDDKSLAEALGAEVHRASDDSAPHTDPRSQFGKARALVEGIRTRGLKLVGVVSGTDHDSRTAAAEIVNAMQAGGVAPMRTSRALPLSRRARDRKSGA